MPPFSILLPYFWGIKTFVKYFYVSQNDIIKITSAAKILIYDNFYLSNFATDIILIMLIREAQKYFTVVFIAEVML